MPTITPEEAIKRSYEPTLVQTILFDKKRWDRKTSTEWLKKHKYPAKYYRETVNNIRRMINHPVENAEFFSKKLPRGITLVYQKWETPDTDGVQTIGEGMFSNAAAAMRSRQQEAADMQAKLQRVKSLSGTGRLPAGEHPKEHYKAQLRKIKAANECCKPYSYLSREQLKSRVERLGAQDEPVQPRPPRLVKKTPRERSPSSSPERPAVSIVLTETKSAPFDLEHAKSGYESFVEQLPAHSEVVRASKHIGKKIDMYKFMKGILADFDEFDREIMQSMTAANPSKELIKEIDDLRKSITVRVKSLMRPLTMATK